MKSNYLLIELLLSFSKKERIGFSQFVNNTYFNGNKEVAALSDELISCVGEDNLEFLYERGFSSDEEKARKEKNKFRVNMSLLLKLAKEFLMIIALKKDQKAQLELLKSQLIEKQQFRLFEQHLKKVRRN